MSLTMFKRRERINDSLPSIMSEKLLLENRSVQSLQPIVQNSKLLSLPAEIKLRIYGYVFPSWTMAVIRPKEKDDEGYDETYRFRSVGEKGEKTEKLVSGPPGFEHLLVCRDLYQIARHRYGQLCTGVLHLGKIKGRMRRTLPAYLMNHPILKRFYSRIRRLNVYFSLNVGNFGLNFRTLFPNLQYVDCVVHEGHYGPIVRLEGTIESFLYGRQDTELRDWTKPIVYHFVGIESRFMNAVHDASSPFDDPKAAVNVKVLGTIARNRGTVLVSCLTTGDRPWTNVNQGFNYLWEGTSVKLVSHVARDKNGLQYWEAGMERGAVSTISTKTGDEAVPQRFRWVHSRKW